MSKQASHMVTFVSHYLQLSVQSEHVLPSAHGSVETETKRVMIIRMASMFEFDFYIIYKYLRYYIEVSSRMRRNQHFRRLSSP